MGYGTKSLHSRKATSEASQRFSTNNSRPSRSAPARFRTVGIALLFTVSAIPLAVSQEGGRHKETKKQQKVDSLFPEAAAEAETNAPPAGYASMYVLRPSRITGIAGEFFLTIDGKIWGCLNNGQFSWDLLPPGPHTFTKSALTTSNKPMTAEAGQTYYAIVTANTVKFVSKDEGEKMREGLSFNPQRWLYRQYLAKWPAVKVGMEAYDVAQLIRLSNGLVYEVKAQNGLLFRGQGMIGDAPITWSPDSAKVDLHAPIMGRESPIKSVEPVNMIQFTSAAVGYRLTFTAGTLTEKLDAGQLQNDLACWTAWR